MLSEALQTESYLLDLCSIINKNPELKEKVLELFNVAVVCKSIFELKLIFILISN